LEYALEDALDRVKRESGSAQIDTATSQPKNYLKQPYWAHWDPKSIGPALVINTTAVDSGDRKLISPFIFGDKPDQFLPVWKGGSLANMQLSTAAVLSARFPWMTPSAWFRDANKRTIHLVDGGYYDVSGLTTGLELKRAIERTAAELGFKIAPRLIVLTGVAGPAESATGLDELLDPVRALLHSWGARPYDLIQQSYFALNSLSVAPPAMRVIHLRGMLYELPLGWRLSGGTIFLIGAQDPVPDSCSVDRKDMRSEEWFGADCILKDLGQALL
jgi:hypothetical protein